MYMSTELTVAGDCAIFQSRIGVCSDNTAPITNVSVIVEDPAALQPLLATCGEDELVAEPIGTHVNKVANDDPRCIEVQRSLF